LFNPDTGHAGGDLEARAREVLRLCRLEGARDQTAGVLSYGEEKMLGVSHYGADEGPSMTPLYVIGAIALILAAM
jgi:ABC-type branched-subunit amino acid transport system ATPase component